MLYIIVAVELNENSALSVLYIVVVVVVVELNENLSQSLVFGINRFDRLWRLSAVVNGWRSAEC